MLGLCCQYLERKVNRNNKEEFINIVDEKSLQFNQYLKGKYSNKQIEEVWVHNSLQLFSILKKLNSENIKLFRVSSNLFPLYDSVPELLYNCNTVKNLLKDIGQFAISNQMRLTSHPDQFVVISSNKPEVIDKSFRFLAHHAWIFDQMDLPISPYYAINIHGGTKGNTQTLINSIEKLPYSVKGRLTLENDESSYNVKDLYPVYEATGVPICFDSHHHTFNNAELSSEEALELSISTWGGIRPITHLSNTDPILVNGSFTERRKHSDYIHYIPEHQRIANNLGKIDIELEFKMKNLALFKAMQDFDIKLS